MKDYDRKSLALDLLYVVAVTRRRQSALRVAEASARESLSELSPDLPAHSQKMISCIRRRPQNQSFID
ncbi:hypothetical protein [Tabrizicola aquatica]|uniref:hypothetical protein n=1 Tax=Tabrizicola aquatica TaxID=909926 RepID=UPI000CD0A28B|nr:hypothetical protein [Tabrizicola aquatica]